MCGLARRRQQRLGRAMPYAAMVPLSIACRHLSCRAHTSTTEVAPQTRQSCLVSRPGSSLSLRSAPQPSWRRGAASLIPIDAAESAPLHPLVSLMPGVAGGRVQARWHTEPLNQRRLRGSQTLANSELVEAAVHGIRRVAHERGEYMRVGIHSESPWFWWRLGFSKQAPFGGLL